jgi:hypothetical protein
VQGARASSAAGRPSGWRRRWRPARRGGRSWSAPSATCPASAAASPTPSPLGAPPHMYHMTDGTQSLTPASPPAYCAACECICCCCLLAWFHWEVYLCVPPCSGMLGLRMLTNGRETSHCRVGLKAGYGNMCARPVLDICFVAVSEDRHESSHHAVMLTGRAVRCRYGPICWCAFCIDVYPAPLAAAAPEPAPLHLDDVVVLLMRVQ